MLQNMGYVNLKLIKLAWLPLLVLSASCSQQSLTTVEFVTFSSLGEVPSELVDMSMPISAEEECEMDFVPLTYISRRDLIHKDMKGSSFVMQWLAPKNAQVDMRVKLEKLAETRRNQLPLVELDKSFRVPFSVNADSLMWNIAAKENSTVVICFIRNTRSRNSLRRLDRVHYAFSTDTVQALIRDAACEGKVKAIVFFDPPVAGNLDDEPDWGDKPNDNRSLVVRQPDSTGWIDDKPTYCGYSEGDSSIFFVIDNYYCKHAKGEQFFRIRWPFVVSNARDAGLDVKGAEDDLFYFITVYRVHDEAEAVRLAHKYTRTMEKADKKQKIRARDRGKPLVGKLVTSRMYLRFDDGTWQPATARTKCSGTYPSKECTIDRLINSLNHEEPM